MAPVTNITNGMIDDIRTERGASFVTVTYTDRTENLRRRQATILIVNDETIILDERGNSISPRRLRTGMTIDATISSAMTRSIPPQATAFRIRIVKTPMRDNITVGRILSVDRQNNSFTVIRDGNLSSIIVFNVSDNAMFFDRFGRPSSLDRLLPGMKVRVRHANFMTASIPPQTTAFEVRVL